MSVIKKTLFAENLDNVPVLITDTDANSKYFKISELSDTFTGGKNAFLIQGSEFLVPDTIIKIEIKDSQGNIIYHEPGEGMVNTNVTDENGQPIITEYYEGTSKVVAVYIYPDTAYGNCTITILGEAKDVSPEWEGIYNVKWQRQINVNPALANTTKIRFYKRPVASIKETLSPIYTIVSGSKVQSNVVSSFANIKVSQMETFAGDVKRIKVFRTSLGDISDSDLVQDILVESKELLTSYELSGSVVGDAGLFTSETLQKLWIANGLTTELTSSRIDNGVRLSGAGNFKYSASLNLSDISVYELGVDAFYSASTASNLGIYVSGSNNGEYLVGTLNGISPTKNLKDQTIQFTLPKAEPTASLYFSQSQSEWHIGNVSLKLSQDTAFSPSEIEFVTSMPTVIGNETYEFSFEFYDVNNNYVPIAVTQSALFTGGNNNLGGTITLISSSASSSLSQLYAVSSSISGTMTVYSSSASGSILSLSSSVSTSVLLLTGSISSSLSSSIGYASSSVYTLSGSVLTSLNTLSSSVSQSVYQGLLSSFQKVQDLADGNYSGSFISGNIVYAPVIGGQLGYFSTLFKVGQSPNSIYLDARQTPRKIFIGGAAPGGGDTEMSGAYNNTNTSVYLDSAGKFSLGNKLSYDGSTLTVTGNINVAGGNAATDTNAALYAANAAASASISGSSALSAATRAAASASISGSSALSAAERAAASASISASVVQLNLNGVDDKIFTNALGRITKTPSVGTQSGLYLGNTNLGYYDGARWKTYMDNTGLFYLTGSANGNALLWDGSTLTIKGNLTVGSVVPNSVVEGLGVLATRDTVAATHIDNSAVTNAKIATDAVTEAKIATDAVTSGKISANAVVADKIAANAIVADKIAANAVTAGKIIAGAITADKIDANAVTADKISANSINAGKISALDFTGKTAIFDTGLIGGWRIEPGQLSSPPPVGSTVSRLLFNPSPLIAVNNTSGEPKLTIKAGELSQLGAAGNVSISFGSVNFNSFSDSYSNIQSSIYGPSTTFNVGNTGTYSGTITCGSTGTLGTTPSPWSGYFYIGMGIQIATDSSFNNVISQEIIGSSGIGSQGSVAITGQSRPVSIGFTQTGTHYARVYWQRILFSSTTAQTTFFGNNSTMQNATLGQSVEATELTDKGFQVVNSTNVYLRIQREGNFSTTPFVQIGGTLSATGNIIAYYSDKRLKNIEGKIDNPLEKIDKINGVYYTQNEVAEKYGYSNNKRQVGLIAQEVEEILPEVIQQAPFDIDEKDGSSKTGENYLTIDYDKIVPLLVEGIKELKKEIEELKNNK